MVNEKQLVDAKAFHKRVAERKMTDIFPNWKELPKEVQDMVCKHGNYLEMLLETQPTVDAVEVVHGRWIVENEASIRCSECCFNRASIKIPMDYCPNCGAKMDGDGNG